MMKLHIVILTLAALGCSAGSYYFGYQVSAENGAKITIKSLAHDSIAQMNNHALILEAFNKNRLDLARGGVELLVKNDKKHRKKIESVIASD